MASPVINMAALEAFAENQTAVDAASAAALSVPVLASILSAQASAACDFITKQVAPDQTHLVAFQNGLAAVMGSAGEPPTIEPMASAFTQSAAVYGKSAAEFASLVVNLGSASLQLSTVLKTFQSAIATASTMDDLTTALKTFGSGTANLVEAITQAGIAITSPDPIVLPEMRT